MNAAFIAMLLLSMAFAALNSGMAAFAEALIASGDDALQAALALCGGFMFFGGLIELFNSAGLSALIARALRRPLRWLLGGEASDAAIESASINLSANMLGLGNAATPPGLKAAAQLNSAQSARAPDALCMFLILNATSVQLFPSSVVALRAAAGSADAAAIVVPSLIASLASSAVGILLCRAFRKRTV